MRTLAKDFHQSPLFLRAWNRRQALYREKEALLQTAQGIQAIRVSRKRPKY